MVVIYAFSKIVIVRVCAHLRFFKKLLCLGFGFGFGVWVRNSIKVIVRITVRYVMFRIGVRAWIAILYLRAGANKLRFFQMKVFYGLPA